MAHRSGVCVRRGAIFCLAFGAALLFGTPVASATILVTSASDGVFRTDNLGYIQQPSAAGIPVTVKQNGQTVNTGAVYYPHSTIVAQDGTISDTQFEDLLTDNLSTNGNWTQDSLVIHMAQCFSGGFIDELDQTNVQNVEINTASQWASPSYGSGDAIKKYNIPGGNGAYTWYNNGNNYYSNSWYNALTGSVAVPGSPTMYGTTLVGAYSLGETNDPYHASELPQYFSRGTQYTSAQTGPLSFNLMDSDVIGRSAATGQSLANNEYALVFVGSPVSQQVIQQHVIYPNVVGLRHWNDAINYMNYLLAQGYTANHIYFYYGNGQAPAYGQALPAGLAVDGAATTENFSNFFTDVVQNCTGQVNVWTSDHGGLNNVFQGKVPLKQAAGGKGNVVMNLQLGGSLDAYVQNPNGDATLQIPAGGITGLASGDKMDVLVSDPQGDQYDLGTISSDGGAGDNWNVDVPLADLATMDQDELGAGDTAGDFNVELADYDVTDDPNVNDTTGLYSGDYSDVDIDGFSLNFSADQVQEYVPEPSTFAIAGIGCASLVVLRRARRRRQMPHDVV